MSTSFKEMTPQIIVIATQENSYVREVVGNLCGAGKVPVTVLLGSRSERLIFRMNSLLRIRRQLGWSEVFRRIRRGRGREEAIPTQPLTSIAEMAARYKFDLRRYPLGNSGSLILEIAKRPKAVCVLAGCGIVDRSVIRSARGGCLNGHPALLPGLRGVDVVPWALVEGLQVGVSAHFVVESVDAGEIIISRPVPTLRGETLKAFNDRVVHEQAKALTDAVISVIDGTARPFPHDLSKSSLKFAAPQSIWTEAERKLAQMHQ